MLRQILKAGSSEPRLESLSNSDNLLLENFPSSSGAFDSSSSSQNSGVTLADVLPNSVVPYVPSSSGFSAVGLSSAVFEIQSSAGVTDMVANDDILSAVPEAISQTDTSIPEFPVLKGVMPDDVVDILSVNFAMSNAETPYLLILTLIYWMRIRSFQASLTHFGKNCFLVRGPANGRDKAQNAQNMEHLSEQMLLLSSHSK